MSDCNVLGGALEQGGTDPLTGFYRDGCQRPGPDPVGTPSAPSATTEFLAQRSVGNDSASIARPPRWLRPEVAPLRRWGSACRSWVKVTRELMSLTA